MRRIALAACMIFLTSFHGLLAQSIVFVSPSNKGLLTMSCAEGSLGSFEQLHYLAAAHYLAEHLCQQPQIDGAVGVWKGHAENSDHEPRRIEGRAAPADAQHGKIKVRVFVTPQLELIFNAPYHFGDTEPHP